MLSPQYCPRALRVARLLSLPIVLAIALALLPAARPAQAQAVGAVIVKSLADTDDATKDNCTLREALQSIANAKNGSGPANYHECTGAVDGVNTITFAAGGTIKLTTTLPDIISIVTITGPVIIDGGAPDAVMIRVSGSDPKTTILSLAGVTLTNGGHAILVTNGGMVNVAGSSFIGNSFSGNGGAAIDTNGPLNIAGSNFTGNKAPGGNGGAIIASGSSTLNIAGSAFNGNSAKLSGGAIYAQSTVNLTDVVFNGNIASGDDGNSDGVTAGGGAVFYGGGSDKKLTVTRGVFNGNLSPKGSGGALFVAVDSNVAIVDSSFQGNLAGTPTNNRLGGAIASIGGKVDIRRSTLLNNGVVGDGGAIANNRKGELTLTNVAITANAASGRGGGVYNNNTQQGSPITPQTTARNSTIALNVGPGGGGGIYNMAQAPFTIGNTIIAESGGQGGDCAGFAPTSQGHNLDSDSSCGLSGAGDISGQAPKLEVPFFNGGPLAQLLTQKLKPGSPAIDAGDPVICAADPVSGQDIRGEARPQDGNGDGAAVCDIGAFENDTIAPGFGSTPVAPGPLSLGSAIVDSGTASSTFSVFNTGDAPLTVTSPTLGGANPGDFSVDPSLSLTIHPGDTPQPIAVSCAPTELGTRSATLTLATNDASAPSPSFNLLCTGTAAPAPAFGSTPAAPGLVSIGEVLEGEQGGATIVLKNSGDAPLTIGGLALGGANPGDFAVPGGFSAQLGPGATADLPIICSPQDLGLRTAALTLQTNDPLKPAPSFDLSCTGTTPPPPVLVPVDGGTITVAGPPLPYGVAVSPDGQQVYARNLGGTGVRVFQRNPLSGDLGSAAFVASADLAGDGDGAGLIVVSPDGKNVYATGAGAPNGNAGMQTGAVVAFSRDPETGALTALGSGLQQGDSYGFCLPTCPTIKGLGGAYGMALSPDGAYLYVSGWASDSITVLRRSTADGSIAGIFNVAQEIVPTGDASKDLNNPYEIVLSPDGATLYAANYADHSLSVYSRDAATGALAFVEKQKQGAGGVDGLAGVFRVRVSPDGASVYTAAYDSDAVAAFGRAPGSGKLTFLAAYKGGAPGLEALDAGTSVAVSPDGAHVFATSYSGKAVVIFARNPLTGLLTPSQTILRNPPSGAPANPALAGARDLALSPDGATAYVTAHSDAALVTLKVPNPRPVIEALRPGSATAGGPAFSLTVLGQSFLPSSTVQWNGSPRPTTYVGPTELRAEISAADLATGGPFPITVPITVVSPAPGGGISNAVDFTITGPSDNPAPAIERISPLSAQAGGPAFTLLVVGSGYIPGSKVRWNGSTRPTTYVSPTTLQAEIGAADIAQPGVAGVTVANPAPGGGVSNARAFTIAGPGENPRPTITILSPPSIIAGSLTAPELTITVSGGGFINDTQLFWNGEGRPTTYVSESELRVAINAADLSAPGVATITALNPGPGGGSSNAAAFRIGASGENPVPVIRDATVQAVGADGAVTLRVRGAGFLDASQAQWNGQTRPTARISDTELTVAIARADFGAGSGEITVMNPAPGGGASNGWLFVVRRLFLPALAR